MNLEIANRLQKLRKEKGYSQEQLAAELGISRQAVSKWERAESSPDTDNLICLAKLYGVSLDELLSTDETIEEILDNNKKDAELVQESEEEKEDQIVNNNKVYRILEGMIPIVATITYLLLGSLLDLWHPGWIVFLFIPILITLIESIILKKVCAFAYPVFATAVFLFIGCVFKWWHPGWVVFLTIPVFYMIGEQIDNRKK